MSYSQSKTYKLKISEEEVNDIMLTQKAIKLNEVFMDFDRRTFYGFENSKKLLFYYNQTKEWFISNDYDLLFSNEVYGDITKRNVFTPFFKERERLQHFNEKIVNEYISELLKILNIDKPFELINEKDLVLINSNIKKIGYDYIYENYYVHLIVFIGKYIMEKKLGYGGWIIEKDVFRIGEYHLYFTYENNFKEQIINQFLRDMLKPDWIREKVKTEFNEEPEEFDIKLIIDSTPDTMFKNNNI